MPGAPDLRDPTKDVLSEVVTALVRRHGGPSQVARRVAVDRTRVHAWMKGDIGIDRLGQLAYELKEPVVVRFGPDTTKDPPPDWAEGLATRVADSVVDRLATLLDGPESPMAQVADFAAALRESGLLPGEESLEEAPAPRGAPPLGPLQERSRRGKA